MQYRLTAIILIILALVLNFKPIAQSPLAMSEKSAVNILLYPFEKGISFSFYCAKEFVMFFVNAYGFNEENKKLKAQIQVQKVKLSNYDSLVNENEEYKKALNFSRSSPYSARLVPASIIGRQTQSWNFVVIIDAGSNQGASSGMSVVSAQGLVGRIIETYPNSSKVLLLTSPQSMVSIMLLRNNVYGICRGGFGNKLILEYIPENASVEVNDRVVVSQASNSYMPGALVGRVSNVKKNYDNIFQKIEVAPSADISKIRTVFVCKR